MKKMRNFLALIFLLYSPLAWATSPSSIELTYDPQKKNLHIEIAHVAHDPREHHIRKVQVFLNEGTPIDLYFPTQTSPSQLIVDVPLSAQEEDQIRVLAICNEAGRKEETLVVPAPEEESATSRPESPTRESLKPVESQKPAVKKSSSSY